MNPNQILHQKYYDKFNFYFAKPINEILANCSVPHVILFNDWKIYDEKNEYFKRFFRR